MKKITFLLLAFLLVSFSCKAQNLNSTPPMGFMTWNYFGLNFNEDDIKTLTDAMVESGLKDCGYNYIFIDDGWQGGRDNKNNIIPDASRFPSGLKALCDYVHSKGMKIGIYSDAAQLTCGGLTASFGFEEQDAKTFAEWGFDYLKYDYCNAPPDQKTAIERYTKMSEALKKSGSDITLAICEWGDRQPWLWGRKAGGGLWRTTADIRDKWYSGIVPNRPSDLHSAGAGILDILNLNAELDEYSGPGGWNDADMLIVGLYGKKGPSGMLGGVGCNDTEYQTQMSLWCMMASPLMITCDVRSMNEQTKRILMNKEVISINQDILGTQAKRMINENNLQVFLKPLQNGDYALGIFNSGNTTINAKLKFSSIGLKEKMKARDLWSKKETKAKDNISTDVLSHETKLYRLSK